MKTLRATKSRAPHAQASEKNRFSPSERVSSSTPGSGAGEATNEVMQRGGSTSLVPAEHHFAAHHGVQDLRLVQLARGHGEEVALHDGEVRQLAGLDRAA